MEILSVTEENMYMDMEFIYLYLLSLMYDEYYFKFLL